MRPDASGPASEGLGEIETMIRRMGQVGAMVLGLIAGGCGVGSQQGPLSATQVQDLKLRDVGELYRLHQVLAKKPPRSLKDFIQIGDAAALTAFGAIRSGEVVVRWQATLPDTEPEPTSPGSDEVLAYWKAVPQEGGPVMMLDRRLRRMTAEEFKAARLAGTGEPASGRSP